MKKILLFILLFLSFFTFTHSFIVQAQTPESSPTSQPANPLIAEDLASLETYKKRLDEIQNDQVILQSRIVEGQTSLKNETTKAQAFLEIEEITPEEFKPYLNQWRLMTDSYRDVLKDIDHPIDEVSQMQVRLSSRLKLLQIKITDLKLALSQLSKGEKNPDLTNSLTQFNLLNRLYETQNDRIEKILSQLGKNKTALTLSYQLCEQNRQLLEKRWESIRFTRFKMRQQPKFSEETFFLAKHELKYRIQNFSSSLDLLHDYLKEVFKTLTSKNFQALVALFSILGLGFVLFWIRKIARKIPLEGEFSILEKFGRRFFVSFSTSILFFSPFLILGIILFLFSDLRQPIGWFIFISGCFAYGFFLTVQSIYLLLKNYHTFPPLLTIPPAIANRMSFRSALLFIFIYLHLFIDLMSSILEYESEASRLIQWCLDIFIFSLLFFSARASWISSLTHYPNRWMPRFLKIVLRIFILLILVSIIALDGMGYTYLSDYLADGSLKSLGIIPLLLFLKKGFDELINHNFFEKGFSRFKINFDLLSKWKKTLHHWVSLGFSILFIFWIVTIWDVRPEFINLGHKFLAQGFLIGKMNLTIGLGVSVFLTLYLSMVVSRLIRAILERNFYKKQQWDIGIQHALNTGIHYVIVLVGILIALRLLGFDIQNITVLAGALGVGLGFGLQNLANNFASGIVLLIERPVKVGDLIQLGNVIGRVRQIGARSTALETGERATILIPNGELVSSHVTNWTYGNSIAGFSIPISVAYNTDLENVKKLLIEVAASNSFILSDPAPHIEFKGFGESSIDLILKAWVKDVEKKGEVQTDLFYKINETFKQNKIEIPYPHREVILHEKT